MSAMSEAGETSTLAPFPARIGKVHGAVGRRRSTSESAPPEGERGARERLVAPGDVLVDDDAVRLVAATSTCVSTKGRLVVHPAQRELVEGSVQHVAGRGVRLDEGVARLARAEVGASLVVAVPSSPVFTWSTTSPSTALTEPSGDTTSWHGDDVELRALLSGPAVVRAGLEDGRAALGLLVPQAPPTVIGC